MKEVSLEDVIGTLLHLKSVRINFVHNQTGSTEQLMYRAGYTEAINRAVEALKKL